MKIMTQIFLIFYQLGERTDLKNHIFLFPFKRLREVFNIFKLNGFDYIHEVIIRLLKNIIIRKINSNPIENIKKKTTENNSLKKFNANNTNNNANNTNTINTNKNNNSIDQNQSILNTNNNLNTLANNVSTEDKEDNEAIDSIYSLSNEEVAEINIIILNVFQFIKARINLFSELLKHPKQIINIITNMNIALDTMDFVLTKKSKRILITFNFKIFDILFNLVYLLNENKFITEMERFFSRNDPNLINNKNLVIKMLFGIFKLQRYLKEINCTLMVIKIFLLK
jgi:hypothetical protein